MDFNPFEESPLGGFRGLLHVNPPRQSTDATVSGNGPSGDNETVDDILAISFRGETSPLSNAGLQSQVVAGNSNSLIGSLLASGGSTGSASSWLWRGRDPTMPEVKKDGLESSRPTVSSQQAEEMGEDATMPQEKRDAPVDESAPTMEPIIQNMLNAGSEISEATGTNEPETAHNVETNNASTEHIEEANQRSPSPTVDDQLIPEAQRYVSNDEKELPEPDKAPSQQDEVATIEPSGLEDKSEQPSSSAKGRRRSANDITKVSEDLDKRETRERRTRQVLAPASQLASSTTAPTLVKKRGRKSMPAVVSAANTETPRKRGRPRKSESGATKARVRDTPRRSARSKESESATTPAAVVKATTTPSKRGRPRLSEGAVASTTIVKTPGKRGRLRKSKVLRTPATAPVGTAKCGRPRKSDMTPAPRAASVDKLARTRQAVGDSDSGLASGPLGLMKSTVLLGTPRSVGRPRKIDQLSTPVVTTETPKRRGRPPRDSNLALPTKKTPSSKAAVVEKQDVDNSTATDKNGASEPPKRRGRPPKAKATNLEEPVLEKRGRKAAVKDNEMAASEAPKRRGRPPKSKALKLKGPTPKRSSLRAASGSVEEGASSIAEEHAPKKRGRQAATKTEDTVLAKRAMKRSRSDVEATDEAEAAAEAPARKRGRPTRVAPSVQANKKVASPPPAEKRRTGRKGKAVEDVPAPTAAKAKKQDTGMSQPRATRGRGQKAIESVVEEVETEAVSEPGPVKPKGRGRGRRAAVVEPAEEPAQEEQPEEEPAPPKKRGRPAKSGKGQLPSTKVASVPEEAPKRARGRPSRASQAGTLAKAAAPKGVTKKATAASKVKDTLAPRRSTRSGK